jgi:hypothetical protein
MLGLNLLEWLKNTGFHWVPLFKESRQLATHMNIGKKFGNL